MYTFVSRLFLTFSPRRRSPTQRSSLTYGYSNNQGILDGSDMESLGRRCPPSESIVSILCLPRLVVYDRTRSFRRQSRCSHPPIIASSFLLLVNFLLEFVDADATIKRRSVSNNLRSVIISNTRRGLTKTCVSFEKQRIKRSR